jgi:kynurenine formamidase
MRYALLVLSLFAMSCSGSKHSGSGFANAEWIDLTHTFDKNTLYWPNNANGFVLNTEAEGMTPGGYFYSSYSLCAPEHGGTHLDAPVHFAAGKLSADQLPLSSLTGEAIVVDISAAASRNRDYLLSVADLQAWEKKHGRIPSQAIILVHTGYGRFYPDREKYFGTKKKGPEAIPELHFPGIDPAAAQWLVDKRRVKAMGLDTPSLDYGQSSDFRAHRVLMGANCPGFENLANLDKLPAKGIYVVALPMKIAGGSGGPLRIIAGLK